jgi:hypothetical protein
LLAIWQFRKVQDSFLASSFTAVHASRHQDVTWESSQVVSPVLYVLMPLTNEPYTVLMVIIIILLDLTYADHICWIFTFICR